MVQYVQCKLMVSIDVCLVGISYVLSCNQVCRAGVLIGYVTALTIQSYNPVDMKLITEHSGFYYEQ